MRSLPFPQNLPKPMDAVGTALPAGNQLGVGERRFIQHLFDNYITKMGRSDLIAPNPVINVIRGDDFRTAYRQTYSSGRLKLVRKRLKGLAANRCTCCGGSRPAQLDHHLPKTSFGEYAMFIMNLVPSCGECNQKKSTHAGSTEAKAFLHPYFDPVPNEPYIAVALDIKPGAITAVLSFDNNAAIVNPMIKARMKNQFNAVDVNERIEDEVSEFIAEYCDTIEDVLDNPTPEEVIAYLHHAAKRSARRHGEGSWRAAVLRELAKNDEFCTGGYSEMLQS